MENMDIHVENLDAVRPGAPQGPAPGAPIGPQGPCFSAGGPVLVPQPLKKQDTPETKNMKENFQIFGVASFLYACLYAFCMYRNGSGVTYPFSWQEVSGLSAIVFQN